MITNKLTSDQTHIVVLVAATEAHVDFTQSGQSGEVRVVTAKQATLVNTGTNLVYFRYDGKAATGAAGNDRVLLPSERLNVEREISHVSLYCAVAETVEVTFSA